MKALPEPAGVLAKRPDLVEPMREYLDAARSPNTRKAYRQAIAHFEAWCRQHGEAAWPPTADLLHTYFIDGAQAGDAWATLCVRRAAISVRCQLVLGLRDPPTHGLRLRTLFAGIREKGGPQSQRTPLTEETLRAALKAANVRDRAILLVGIASGMRADELARLELRDIGRYEAGWVLRIRKSKTDQSGKGRIARLSKVGGDLCPVAALEAWIAQAKATEGPLFRGLRRGGHPTSEALSPHAIWGVVKAAVVRAGLDPATFGSHSLRAGFVTWARARGLEWGEIMQQTGHRRIETVLKYDRPKEDDPAAFDRLGKMLK